MSRALSCLLALLSAPALIAAEAVPEPEAAPRPAFCFAPDTPERHANEINARYGLDELLPPGAVRPKHRLATRWSETATDGPGLTIGQPTTITWSYLPDGTPLQGFAGEPATPSNLQAWLTGLYGDFDTWHQLFVDTFERWAELTGNTYVYEPADDGALWPDTPGEIGTRGDVRIAGHRIDGSSGILGYNFFPDFGDMMLDTADGIYGNTGQDSRILRNVLSHEHGHGLGLAHTCPIQGTKLMEPYLATAFLGPQHDDIRGGQRGYGDPFEPNDASADAHDLGSAYPPGASALLASIDRDADEDWHRIAGLGSDAVNGGTLAVAVTPNGFTYLEGPQCGGWTSYDSDLVRDLAFDVVDSDGATVLASVDEVGAGNAETIEMPLGDGDRYLRIHSAPGPDVQLLDLDVLVTANPVIVTDGPWTAECNGGVVPVALDASGSFDPDGGVLASHAWSTTCPGAFSDASAAATVLDVFSDQCDLSCEVTIDVLDDEGESWTESFTLRIEDSIPPSIACPADLLLVTAPGDCEVANPGLGATASDVCDSAPALGDDAPAMLPRGVTAVQHVATDHCGLTASCTQLVTVVGRMGCFAANCSKIQFASQGNDGRVGVNGAFRNCDGTDLVGSLAPDDRIRLVIDGFVEFDEPWSSFAASGPGHKFSSGSRTFVLKNSSWKYTSRESNVTEGDVDEADGVLHELWLGYNQGEEPLAMDRKGAGLQSCRRGQRVVECP